MDVCFVPEAGMNGILLCYYPGAGHDVCGSRYEVLLALNNYGEDR